MLNIPVILGSVREGRKSLFPAQLMVERLRAAGAASELVDIKELALPFLDADQEPSSMHRVYPHEQVQVWSAIADKADGFVIVTPEYNHSFPGVLKNALDWLYPEYGRKAVGLAGVSNGPVGGARAIIALRPVISALNMFSVRETVMFPSVQNIFDAEGKLLDESYNKKVDGFIDPLLFTAGALKQAREKK